MANANDENIFNSTFNNAMTLLQSRCEGRSLQIEECLKQFAEEKDTYSVYRLKTFKGTMGRLGSVSSEQNNSSVVIYLNDGNRKQSDYC